MQAKYSEDIKKEVNEIKNSADKIIDIINQKNIMELSGSLKENVITFYGSFKNGIDSDATFRVDQTVKQLLELDIIQVTKLLSAFGNYERFKILLLLLNKSCTVSEIVKELDFPTTGKAYHHLNALVSSGLLSKLSNGKYHLKARHIQGVLAMLIACHCYIGKSRVETISVDNL